MNRYKELCVLPTGWKLVKWTLGDGYTHYKWKRVEGLTPENLSGPGYNAIVWD